MKDENLTVAELAARQKVSEETVYYWNKTGTGPRFMKIGKYARYRMCDVTAWEKSRLVDKRPA